jgi:PAS domain S-box-containing protein
VQEGWANCHKWKQAKNKHRHFIVTINVEPFPVLWLHCLVLRIALDTLDDITPLQHAAAGLEALVALDLIQDSVAVLDREWRCLFVNEATLKLNRWEKSDVLGKQYWNVVPDLVGTPIDKALRDAFEARGPTSVEVQDEGSGRWYRVDIVPSASTLTIHSADITERKRAGDLSQRLMRSLDNIEDPIFMMDRQWRYSFANLAASQFAGHARDELLGQNIWELSPWLENTPFGRACYRAMESSEPFTLEEYYRPHERWLKVHYFPGADGFTVQITDINDLKQAQERITRSLTEPVSETQLLAMFDLMPNPMMILDHQLRFTYVNAAALVPNKRSMEEVIGRRVWEVNPGLKDSELIQMCRTALESGRRTQQDLLLPASGRWFQYAAIPWNNQLVLEAVDITKLKQSEQSVGILTQTLNETRVEAEKIRGAARSQSQILSQLFDTVSDPILMVNQRWDYTYANSAAYRHMDKNEAEVLGQSVWTLYPEFRGTNFEEAWRRGMAAPGPTSFEEHYAPRDRWFNVHFFPTDDGLVVHAVDITEFRNAQATKSGFAHILHMKSDFMHSEMLEALNLMPDPLAVMDSQLRYAFLNGAARRIASSPESEMLGCTPWEVDTSLAPFEKNYREALKSGERSSFELFYDPAECWFAVELIPSGNQLIAYTVDITRQKKSELAAQRLTDTLEQALNLGWDRKTARDRTSTAHTHKKK